MTIYLDHAASSPSGARSWSGCCRCSPLPTGNPSSPHSAGRPARRALDEAHESVAAALRRRPPRGRVHQRRHGVHQPAIKGAAWAGKATGNRIVTTAVEHRAVLDACASLEKFGFEVIRAAGRPLRPRRPRRPRRRCSRSGPASCRSSSPTTRWAPSPTSPRWCAACGPRAGADPRRCGPGRLIHGLDTRALDVDLLSVAGHKLEGPPGIGVMWLRRGTAILPQVHGGSQERYRRAGTENVAGAVGMAAAWELVEAERAATVAAVRARRDRLAESLLAIEGVELTGHPRDRLPGLLSVLVRGLDGASLVHALDLEGVCCSTGSACTTGSTEPSHVLTAMGVPDEEARGALRLSLGRTTSDADIERGRGHRRARSSSASAARRPTAPLAWAAVGRTRLMASGSWSPCPAASTRRSRPRSSLARVRRPSGSGCVSTMAPTRSPTSGAPAARRTPRTTPGGSPASWASRSTSWTSSASSRAASSGRSWTTTCRAGRRAPASTATRPSSSARSWAVPGRSTGARRSPPATTPASGRSPTRRDPTGHPVRPAGGHRRGQGPELLPVRAAPGPAGPQPVPARGPDQARGPGHRARAGPRHGGQAGEPGAVLRARRRHRRRPPRPGRLAAGSRASSWTPTAATRAATTGPPRTRSASVPVWAWRWASGSTSRPSMSPANVIQLGRREDLSRDVFELDGSEPGRWLPSDGARSGRWRGSGIAASWCPAGSNHPTSRRSSRWRVRLERPAWAPAPGQAAVLYAPDEPARVLGGGRIAPVTTSVLDPVRGAPVGAAR